MSRYVIFQDDEGQWRFRLVAPNGKIIAARFDIKAPRA